MFPMPPLDVLRHALQGIADEMSAVLHRSAHTVVIRDLNDYSCAMFDGHGDLVAQGRNMPTHLGSMGYALTDLIAFWDGEFTDGDVFVTNDPYRGGTHTPDIHIFAPVLCDGAVIAWMGTIAHHADWGGRVPGTISVENASIYEEGVVLPHVRLERAGVPNRDIYELIASNIRQHNLGVGDLRAQVAAVIAGRNRFVALMERYPADVLREGMKRLLDHSEQLVRDAIRGLPDGSYTASGLLDGDGTSRSDDVGVVVRIDVCGDTVRVDFDGTSREQPTAINVPLATTRSAVLFALMASIGGQISITGGCWRPITIDVPTGSLLNPARPAPVSDRHLTSQRVADVLLHAFSQAVPQHATAGWFVGSAWINCFTPGIKTDEPMVLLLNLCGGGGAMLGRDGLDAVDAHMGNATLIPAEVVEMDYPLRVLTYRLVDGSGGRGRWTGGRGIRAEFLNVGDIGIRVQCGMEQTVPVRGAWGLEGGGTGAAGFFAVRRRGEVDDTELLPRRQYVIEPGDVLIMSSGGGGGYGGAERVRGGSNEGTSA